MSVLARAFSRRSHLTELTRPAAVLAALSLAAAFSLSSCTPSCEPLGSTTIHWIALETEEGIFERAAAMVDVQVDGQAVWMQLDTGASSIILSPKSLDGLGIAYERGAVVSAPSQPGAIAGKVRSISMAGITYENPAVTLWDHLHDAPPANLAREPEDPRPLVGTLGASFFSGKVVELDLQQSTLAVFDQMPAEVARSIPFASSGARPTFFANVGETALKAMYDTGSSAFPVLLKPSLYLALTGLGSLEESPLCVTQSSWGKPVTFYGSPYDGAVDVGGTLLSPGRLWAGQLMEAFSAATRCDVIFGNELFLGKHLFIDFGKKRFAVVSVP